MARSVFLAALLLVAAASVQSRTTTLNILHTNDVHARFDQASASAGVCNAANAAAGL
ncbi:ecto-5'-nucleotidase, partial [Haematococcus lacustris]